MGYVSRGGGFDLSLSMIQELKEVEFVNVHELRNFYMSYMQRKLNL